MPKIRVVQVSCPNGPLEIVERPLPEPPPGSVRVRVEACGICHSDSFAKEGTFPGVAFPRVPGHEVAGVLDAIGEGVSGWNRGDRVGVGWHAAHCGRCGACRRGDFVVCASAEATGITRDGGYAEQMIAPATALARIPEALTAVEAAPMMCAGITTFNALRNSGARPGDLLGVLGVGGLGHLAVQFAARLGFETVAIARGREKEALARELGARHYVDGATQDPAAELARLGGAIAILATGTSGKAMSAVLGGLAVGGKLLVLGAADEPLEISALHLIGGRRSVAGWPSGTAVDAEETLAFCARTGVRSRNEVFPLERAAEAFDRMRSGKARFRVVLEVGK